jgi:hypothetical protein
LFPAELKKRMERYVSWGIANAFGGSITLDVEYKNYVVAGDLTVTAHQRLSMPFNITLFGNSYNSFDFYASSTARVFNQGSLINDVNFIFDGVRELFGLDINNVNAFIGGLPGKADDWLTSLTSGVREGEE